MSDVVHTRMSHPQISARSAGTPARRGALSRVYAHSPSSRPLVVTADDRLLDPALRVLAAAGVEAQLATGGAILRRAHRDASLVLVGADVLGSAAVRGLPRRPGVVVVADEDLAADDWATAV